MGKGWFNSDWLEKVDSNNQIVDVWCVKEDDYTATCKLHSKDISVEYIDLGALKQYFEKQKH